ncbi:2-oxo acid dehydrogenase subunit E2 [Pseudomonas sp. 9AZ]|uniref:2-oxo acid dehydrogenase subunit E2 n=1 Tax=Pseudomonas sp. 9AZ TaxID=2653168 RepID=UPI001C4996B9|nr:2-oxo acid dehydrogenase subunit E2 [Pseudomonas sp. 9AZ]
MITANAHTQIKPNNVITEKAANAMDNSIENAAPESVPHSMTRLTIARRLTESKQQVPHFYVKGACRIDALLALRKQINEGAEVKASVNDLIVRAVALALREVPDANVSWGEKAMLRHQQVDVAVAVATPRGLITPIVRNVEQKQPAEIASEIRALAERARSGKLKPNEYQGGTVTVSNLGMFGVEEFSAIINPPQSMIFAIGAGVEHAIACNGQLEVGTLMNVTVSVDHRAVDGVVAAQVFAAFKRLIEQPESLSAA